MLIKTGSLCRFLEEGRANVLVLQDKNRIYRIPIEKIHANPAQPRKIFYDTDLKELADSIRENGLLQPITVRKIGTEFELVAGERRLRASKMAGCSVISCILTACDDRQSAVYALLENLQRKDLEIFEEAEGLQKIIKEWGITQEEAALRLGKSQSALANKLRLLRLSPQERKIITENELTERHARAFLRIQNEEQRSIILKEVIEKNLNVAQTEKLVADAITVRPLPQKTPKRRLFVAKDIRIFMNTIDHAVDTMKQSGIAAIAEKQETETVIEYRIRIEKAEGVKRLSLIKSI